MVITIFQIGSTTMYIIMVDTKQGYHQIKVRERDVEILSFSDQMRKNTVSQ